MEHTQLAKDIASILYDRKAQDILVLNVSGITVLCDIMVIASGRSAQQVKTLSDEVEARLAGQTALPRHIEGYHEGRWIVMDYHSVIVHLFHQEERAFYHLERLWADGSNRVPMPFDGETDNA
ncbi:MAG: ribosome silencing factor [Clostridia bacterium]|nr:ribosome silencing factor [Clostridia bacterium]